MRIESKATIFTGIAPVASLADEDPASLDHLADIISLPPVAWWPVAPGWYIVLCALLLLVAIAVTVTLIHRRQNNYRRAAILELDRLKRDDMILKRIAEILKRTALVILPRQRIAVLSGEAWVHWLEQTAPDVTFSSRSRQLLIEQVYQKGIPDSDSVDELLISARGWIEHHQSVLVTVPELADGQEQGM